MILKRKTKQRRNNMKVLLRLEEIKDEFEKELLTCSSVNVLEEIRVKYLGRKGELTQL